MSKLDFYSEKGHTVNLPVGTTANSSAEDILSAADKEHPSHTVIEAKEQILAGWQQHSAQIIDYLNSLTFEVPKSVRLVLSQYGAGGSYNINTCEIVVNVNYKADPLSILVHELTHLVVDSGLVHKFSLNHEEKENLIKWLISNNGLLSGFIKVPTQSPVVSPRQDVLGELAKRDYSDI